MRERLETLLNETWYGGNRPGMALRALESVYRRLQAAHWKRELNSRDASLEGAPVIVVGNLTAGGSGKTPLVIRLCGLFSRAGLKPAVVSRGYGRSGKGQVLVGDAHSASEVGDEPLLIHRRCNVPVMVGADRVRAVHQLFDNGADVVVSDDGLQSMRLARAVEICVVDGDRGFGNGRMLPAGPLREPVSRLDSVDYVVCNGTCPGEAALPDRVTMHLEPDDAVSLNGEARKSLNELAELSRSRPFHAVAGIGNPGRFFSLLAELGINAIPHPFPDHHEYRRMDFERCGDAPVLMTEKDAVKCAGLGLESAWYIPVAARLPAAWEDEMMRRIRRLLAQRGT